MSAAVSQYNWTKQAAAWTRHPVQAGRSLVRPTAVIVMDEVFLLYKSCLAKSEK